MTNKHDSAIIFLYTGEYGVVTDSSGLYYMRARYYDPTIKRFINQDVLTGSITDSPTLNRYAYVNGNPISLSDPFGLSPILNWLGDINGHRVLDLLGMIPGAGFVFDLANAIWYANEGNTKEALLSLASSLPGAGDAIGAISKGSKMLNMINKACHVFGYGANLYYASDNLIKDAKNIAQSIENGNGVSIGQVFNLAVSAAGISHSAKGLQNSLHSYNRINNKRIKSTEYGVGEYLNADAPYQVTPGIKELRGQHINDKGRVEPWSAHYDEYGRLIARTDYNAGNIAHNIPEVHHHLYEWGPGKTPYEYGSHLEGEYIP